jgi:CDP-diacylglycerol--serine O-phosphatidyltransferase
MPISATRFVATAQGAFGESLRLRRVEFAGVALHPMVIKFAVSGLLMVSRIRFPKL